jgi:putative hemolysin
VSDTTVSLLLLLLCLLGSGLYSGAETALYGLSRVRLELDADRGRPLARLLHRLVQADNALLITILIGNNLMLEVASGLAGGLVASGEGLDPAEAALRVTLVLTPAVFLLGEVLPKELSRRRPHGLIGAAVPLLVASRLLFWPLERVLSALAWLLQRALGIRGGRRVLLRGRASISRFLEEGARMGTVSPRATELARNALGLRSATVERCMTPWREVECLPQVQGDDARATALRAARHARLPVTGEGGAVVGYVHLLEVLADREAGLEGALRPLPAVPPGTSIASALLQLRGGGRRLALIGTAEQPLGLVSLKDLLEEITGDVAGL